MELCFAWKVINPCGILLCVKKYIYVEAVYFASLWGALSSKNYIGLDGISFTWKVVNPYRVGIWGSIWIYNFQSKSMCLIFLVMEFLVDGEQNTYCFVALFNEARFPHEFTQLSTWTPLHTKIWFRWDYVFPGWGCRRRQNSPLLTHLLKYANMHIM